MSLEEKMTKKYGITFDEDGWPDIKGVKDYEGISYDAIIRLLLMRTVWTKRKVDRLRSLV